MRAILSTKAVWAAAKDAKVTKKVQTTSMIAKKSWGEVEICYTGGAEILELVVSKGIRGTRGAEEASEACSGAVTTGVVDTGIWGSSTSIAGNG